jgi:unsaturated rhamnogalacturonyl hydrolase
MGLYGWGRGLGWYAIGLIDSWSELEQENEHKKTLEEFIITFAKSAIEFQYKNGAWSWTVTRPETRLDSSTTATLSWFMLNASKIDAISDECIASYNKAIKYLMSVTKRNGSIDFSQGDTKDIGVYSLLFDILPFTQGFAIRAINKKYNKS